MSIGGPVSPPAIVEDTLAAATKALESTSDSPRLDAELLLCAALNEERSYLFAHPDAWLDPDAARIYRHLLERRLAGEPIAYIRGVREFWSLPLKVSPDVLVPRPETELLVELGLELPAQHTHARVADLGTGSGAIAVALASERPEWRIVATDNSAAALDVARANAKALDCNNIEFREGDWLAPLAGDTFDLIASNPPYIAADDPYLTQDTLKFEPRHALVSPANGLADLEAIIEQAGPYLAPGGWLALEHGDRQGADVRALFCPHGFAEVETKMDLAGKERATMGRLLRVTIST